MNSANGSQPRSQYARASSIVSSRNLRFGQPGERVVVAWCCSSQGDLAHLADGVQRDSSSGMNQGLACAASTTSGDSAMTAAWVTT